MKPNFQMFVLVTFASFMLLTSSAQGQCNEGQCRDRQSSGVKCKSGPGTEMTRIINRIGLGSDCVRCKQLAAEMDRGGPEWVSQNFNCVVKRTVSNAKALGHRWGRFDEPACAESYASRFADLDSIGSPDS